MTLAKIYSKVPSKVNCNDEETLLGYGYRRTIIREQSLEKNNRQRVIKRSFKKENINWKYVISSFNNGGEAVRARKRTR